MPYLEQLRTGRNGNLVKPEQAAISGTCMSWLMHGQELDGLEMGWNRLRLKLEGQSLYSLERPWAYFGNVTELFAKMSS